jgi:hypothetical protein
MEEKKISQDDLCKMPITKRLEWFFDNDYEYFEPNLRRLNELISFLQRMMHPKDCRFGKCPIPFSCPPRRSNFSDEADYIYSDTCGLIFLDRPDPRCGCSLLADGAVKKSLILHRLRMIRRMLRERGE